MSELKRCTARGCKDMHDTKYKLCVACRIERRDYMRNKAGNIIWKIQQLCIQNRDNPLAKEIIKLL
jgi:hypothetical protein